MRTRQSFMWLLILTAMATITACQPVQAISAPPILPAMVPIMAFEVTPVPTSTLVPTPVPQSESGVRLTALIDTLCTSAARPDTGCVQPYAGEFVVTELNYAEVTRVVTNHEGQATVELPPGKYILGVRTEGIYPLAAPAKVNVLADHYVSISFSLDSGMQR